MCAQGLGGAPAATLPLEPLAEALAVDVDFPAQAPPVVGCGLD